jgi:hypothetical protein
MDARWQRRSVRHRGQVVSAGTDQKSSSNKLEEEDDDDDA